MLIHVAPSGTDRPQGPPPARWSVLGAADDSTLPTDGGDILRLRLHDRDADVPLPLGSTSVWVTDLGVYRSDVSLGIDGAVVITVAEPSASRPRPGTSGVIAAHADANYDEPDDVPLAALDDDD